MMATSESPKTPETPEIENELLEVGTISKVSRRKRRAAAQDIQRLRTGIVLTGVVRDGKVLLDQESLDEIAQKFGNANIAFVAVNAPFDPKPVIE